MSADQAWPGVTEGADAAGSRTSFRSGRRRPTAFAYAFAIAWLAMVGAVEAKPLNQVLGTWQMGSARIDPDGSNQPAYGPEPKSLLVFTPDMHVIEVMTDSTIPKFASNARGHGTAEENRAAMAGSIGWFGTYTIDDKGQLSGDRVEGSTFPNWVGDVRTRKDLHVVVDGDRMIEHFRRPEGSTIVITWRRVR